MTAGVTDGEGFNREHGAQRGDGGMGGRGIVGGSCNLSTNYASEEESASVTIVQAVRTLPPLSLLKRFLAILD